MAEPIRVPCDVPPPSDLDRARALEALEASTSARLVALDEDDLSGDLDAEGNDVQVLCTACDGAGYLGANEFTGSTCATCNGAGWTV